jgi:hypothetical protein
MKTEIVSEPTKPLAFLRRKDDRYVSVTTSFNAVLKLRKHAVSSHSSHTPKWLNAQAK